MLDCDFGIGVVLKRTMNVQFDKPVPDINNLKFVDLEANRRDFLGLTSPERLPDILDHIAGAHLT